MGSEHFVPVGNRHPKLQELRILASTHPDDNSIRGEFCQALSESIFDTTANHLEELRELWAANPNHPVPRKWLAKALYSLLFFESEEHELRKSNALFKELRQLSKKYPEDAGTAEPLAMALFYELSRATRGNKLLLREKTLKELRDLARRHSEHREIQQWLNSGNELVGTNRQT